MTHKTKTVIVGAGFGGIAAKRLAGSAIEITLIDRRNDHLFQPMLYQVATADIAWPIRGLFSGERNIAGGMIRSVTSRRWFGKASDWGRDSRRQPGKAAVPAPLQSPPKLRSRGTKNL